MLNCFCFFIVKCIVKCNESEHKINSFIIYLAKIIFKISWVWNLEGYIFEKFFFYHLKTLGWTCGFCAVDDLPLTH